jgi:hypothetical protein
MEEIRGVTAIDTMYELKGFQMAQSFYEVIFPWARIVLPKRAEGQEGGGWGGSRTGGGAGPALRN